MGGTAEVAGIRGGRRFVLVYFGFGFSLVCLLWTLTDTYHASGTEHYRK